MSDTVATILLGVAFGLVGGLVVSRFGAKKGYGSASGFVVGFVVVFVLGFLPLILFVILGATFLGVAAKFPDRARSSVGKGSKRKPPPKADRPTGLPGWGDN